MTCHSLALTAVGIAHGMRIAARTTPRPLNALCIISAMIMPMTVSRATATMVTPKRKSDRRPRIRSQRAGRAFDRAATRRRALLQQPGLVVGESGELTALVEEAGGGIQARVLLERADDRLDDRIPDDERQQQDRRSHQEEGEPTLAGSDLLAALLGPIAFCQFLLLQLMLLVRLPQAQIACVTWSLLGLPTSQRIGL